MGKHAIKCEWAQSQVGEIYGSLDVADKLKLKALQSHLAELAAYLYIVWQGEGCIESTV